jgi:hypothetical protein
MHVLLNVLRNFVYASCCFSFLSAETQITVSKQMIEDSSIEELVAEGAIHHQHEDQDKPTLYDLNREDLEIEPVTQTHKECFKNSNSDQFLKERLID